MCKIVVGDLAEKILQPTKLYVGLLSLLRLCQAGHDFPIKNLINHSYKKLLAKSEASLAKQRQPMRPWMPKKSFFLAKKASKADRI